MAADERPSGPGGAIPDNKAASFARAFAKIMESAGPGKGLLQVGCHNQLVSCTRSHFVAYSSAAAPQYNLAYPEDYSAPCQDLAIRKTQL